MTTIKTLDQRVTEAVNAARGHTTARFFTSKASANRSAAQLRRRGWTVEPFEEIKENTRVDGDVTIHTAAGFIVRAHIG